MAVLAPAAAPANPWRPLGRAVAPWRLALVGVLGTFLLSAVFELVPPLVVSRLIDNNLSVGRSDGLLQLALVYLGALLSVQATTAFGGYWLAVIAQRAINGLRVQLFTHLQRLPISYFDRTPPGNVLSRCAADADTVEMLFSTGVALLIADLFRLLTIAVAMVALSPVLSLIAALTLPPLLVLTRVFQMRVRTAGRANRAAVGQLVEQLQETLVAAEVIRAYARAPTFVARFRRGLHDVLRAFNRATGHASVYGPLLTILAAAITGVLLWAPTTDLARGANLSVGTVAAFVLLFQRFFKPITTLGDQWQTVQEAISAAERISEILIISTEDGGAPAPPSATGQSPALEVRRLTFGYALDRPVLHDISFAVWPGEHVAVVGRSGAGKSSLVSLLGGLYAPWSGRVLVDGRDPQGLAPEERRGVLGVVPQLVQLFPGTILDNLTLGDSSIAPDLVERAAALTGADGWMRGLSDGYATLLGGDVRGEGIQLSNGQRQQLALTRALVTSPPVLLFDEATAAVDAATDAAFRTALRTSAHARGSAVLTVAHRLSTARDADRVIVLEAGRILEEGAPSDLVGRDGAFAALVELEAAGWDWRSAD